VLPTGSKTCEADCTEIRIDAIVILIGILFRGAIVMTAFTCKQFCANQAMHIREFNPNGNSIAQEGVILDSPLLQRLFQSASDASASANHPGVWKSSPVRQKRINASRFLLLSKTPAHCARDCA